MNSKRLQKIMYVEDEPDITTIAKIALEDIGGFTVQYCSSGMDALKQAPQFRPDLLLLDVMMPEMDGIKTYKELKKIPEIATTPVVFMTAKAQAKEINDYLSLGALDVITKPFDPITLADEIRKIWKNHSNDFK